MMIKVIYKKHLVYIKNKDVIFVGIKVIDHLDMDDENGIWVYCN